MGRWLQRRALAAARARARTGVRPPTGRKARHRATVKDRTSYQAMLYVTSLTADQAEPADLLAHVRQHWSIEVLHWVRDVTFGEDASRFRRGSAPRVIATLPKRSCQPAQNPRHRQHRRRTAVQRPQESPNPQTPGASTRLNAESADFAVPVVGLAPPADERVPCAAGKGG